jgi:phage shock protein E
LGEIPKKVDKIKKMGKPVVLCCRSGNRSVQATQILKQKGLENIYNGGSWNNVNSLKNTKKMLRRARLIVQEKAE